MKKKSRGEVEEETGVVTQDSTNTNSSHLQTAGLFKDYLKVVVVMCLVLYQQTADLFLPTLPRLLTVSTLHATMTQAADRHINLLKPSGNFTYYHV
jgi:hypothetical protein